MLTTQPDREQGGDGGIGVEQESGQGDGDVLDGGEVGKGAEKVDESAQEEQREDDAVRQEQLELASSVAPRAIGPERGCSQPEAAKSHGGRRGVMGVGEAGEDALEGKRRCRDGDEGQAGQRRRPNRGAGGERFFLYCHGGASGPWY